MKLFYLFIGAVGFSLSGMCTTQDSVLKYGLKLYVSTEGNNSWTGNFDQPNQDKTDGPFATLEGARDAIRKGRKSISQISLL